MAMILTDVNVLINAFHPEAVGHAAARSWLNSTVNSEATYGVSPQVLASFVRITTNRRAFVKGYPLEESLGFAEALLSRPNCEVIQPGRRHWEIYTDLCRTTRATGDLTQDAWFAALAIESGCEWITLDRDFARFPGLRWRKPF